MNIQTISGHLTSTNKKHLKALFDAKLTTGKVNRINYFISFHIDFWSVKIVQVDKNNSSGFEKSKATFKIN
jgi:5-methylcytosine-specific restriction endonuclease McrBC GTP-binding regulatory subunit McrB